MLLARATSNSLRPSIIGSRQRRFLLLTLSLTLPSAANSLSSNFPSSRQMSTFVTERTGDGTITVSPKNEANQSALVVISHGLGDSAEGFADVAEVSTSY
jgi:predicted dienelactone hydrolase